MEISGMAASLPQREMSNEEIIDLVKFYSKKTSSKHLQTIIDEINCAFIKTGTKTRYWLNSQEKPLDLISDTFQRVITQSHLKIEEIDAVIYCSIYRGFMEPATASILSKKLGIRCRHAFDILDACMGWCTSLEISSKFFKTKEWNTVAIIASEFPNEKDGAIIPKCYQIGHPDELKWKFAALTMGEGVSVTILTNSYNKTWDFVRSEQPEGAHLCSVPLHNYTLYLDDINRDTVLEEYAFAAYSGRMSRMGFRRSVEVMERFIDQVYLPDIIVPHGVSERLPRQAASKLSANVHLASTYSDFGNLSSASVPISILAATGRGEITTSSRIAGWISSAGLKHCAFSVHINPDLLRLID